MQRRICAFSGSERRRHFSIRVFAFVVLACVVGTARGALGPESAIYYIRLADDAAVHSLKQHLRSVAEVDFGVEREHPAFDRVRAAERAGVGVAVMPDLSLIYRLVLERPVPSQPMVEELRALPFVAWAESATGLERRAASSRRAEGELLDDERPALTEGRARTGSRPIDGARTEPGTVTIGIFDSWYTAGEGPSWRPDDERMPDLVVFPDTEDPIRFRASYAGHGIQVASVAHAALKTRGNDAVQLKGYWCILRNIPRMVDEGVRVISISALYSDRPRLREYVKYALASGVVVVAAAGNHYSLEDGVNYPAAYYFHDLDLQVIAVAATDAERDAVAGFVTSPGNDPVGHPERAFIDVAAPGVDVPVIDVHRRDGRYIVAAGTATGTSLSVPAVSALAAELLATDSDLSVREVYELITHHADRAPVGAWTPELGFGRINPTRSLNGVRFGPAVRIEVEDAREGLLHVKADLEFGIPPFRYAWAIQKSDGTWVRTGAEPRIFTSMDGVSRILLRVTDSTGRTGRHVVALDELESLGSRSY